MRYLLRISLLLLAIGARPVFSADAFTIKSIHIEGLRGISQEAVLHQLPIKPGQLFSLSDSNILIKALYATKFFEDVKVKRRGDQLTISVVERPVIMQVKLEGSHGIPKEILDKFLKEQGLVGGEFFNAATLENLKSGLLMQYMIQSQTAARVDIDVENIKPGQVNITIKFSPGPTLQFERIRILGNKIFKEQELLSALPIHPNRVWAFLTMRDTRYNQETRRAALAALSDFYKDRGYFRMTIPNERISLTPDRKAAYWVIEVNEGPLYQFGNYRILGGYDLDDKALSARIPIKSGELYSKQAVTSTEKAITRYLGNQGYLFAKVKAITSVNERTRQVNVAFHIDQGKKTYVRQIHILGNHYIQDKVIRSQLQQQEGSLASMDALKESERRINRSGFVSEPASLMPIPLDPMSDQVDLQLPMNERRGTFSLAPSLEISGFSWKKVQLTFPFKMENAFGTGKNVDFNFSKVSDRNDITLSFDYADPFGNIDGIQQRMKVYWLNSMNRWSKVIDNLEKSKETQQLERKNLESSTQSSSKETKESSEVQAEAPQESSEVIPERKKIIERTRYDTMEAGLNYSWRFPIDAKGNAWTLELEGKYLKLYLPTEDKEKAKKASVEKKYKTKEPQEFVDRYGDEFFQFLIKTGLYSDQLEGFMLPNKGFQYTLNGQYAFSRARSKAEWYNYFKLTFAGTAFMPPLKTMSQQEWIAGFRWNMSYGNNAWLNNEYLPFFDNFHSGRIRGYEDDAFGPKDSQDRMLGANFLVSGRGLLCFPKPFSGDRFRTSLFLDAGNLYQVDRLDTLWQQTNRTGKKPYEALKWSVGVGLDVVIPLPMVGPIPINVSLARPFSLKEGETGNPFQFQIGSSLTIA